MDIEAFSALIQGLGAVCAIPFAVLFYMATYNIERHDAFVDVATRSRRKSLFDDFPPPLYHPRRLGRLVFLIMAWMGGGYIVFGIASALLGWMSQDWRVWSDTWDGARLSTVVSCYVAGFSMFLLPLVWDKIAETSRQRREREDS